MLAAAAAAAWAALTLNGGVPWGNKTLFADEGGDDGEWRDDEDGDIEVVSEIKDLKMLLIDIKNIFAIDLKYQNELS